MTVAKGKSSTRGQAMIKNSIEATTADLIGLVDRFDSFPNFPLDRTEINKLDMLKSQPFLIPCENFKRTDWNFDFVDLIIISLITKQLFETEDKVRLVKENCRLLLKIIQEPFVDFVSATALVKRLAEFTDDNANHIFCEPVCEMLVQAVSGQTSNQLEWGLSLIKFFLEGLNSTCVLAHLSKRGLPEILQRLYESSGSNETVCLLIRDLAVHFGLPNLWDDLPEFHAMQAISKLDTILDEVVYGKYDLQKGADAIYVIFSSSKNIEAYPLIEAAGALLIYIYLAEHESLILRMLFLNQNLSFSLEGMFFSPMCPLLNSSLINDICQSRDGSHSTALEIKDFNFASNDFIEKLLHVTLLLPPSQEKKLLAIILLCIDQNISHFSYKEMVTHFGRIVTISSKSHVLTSTVISFFDSFADKTAWKASLNNFLEWQGNSQVSTIKDLCNC